MKILSLLCLMLAASRLPLYSQQAIPFPAHDKVFKQSEIERYKALLRTQMNQTSAGDNIDVTYYRLDVAVTTSPQFLRGVMTMKAFSIRDNVGQITLDLMQTMSVDSVKAGGVTVSATQHPSTFDITLDRSYNTGELIVVDVYYSGRPGSSGLGSFEFSAQAGKPWVWTLSEPYGAKDWWPCKDHPLDKADSADIIVTCDSSLRVGSNGRLVSVASNGDGTKTHHWHESYPIATYLVCLAFTNYAQFSNWFKYTPTDSMEVLTYALPSDLSAAMAGAPYSVDGLNIFSSLFGLYPFIREKYGHAEFGWGGAMEHQTMTYTCCFGEDILVHELSHHWFGDMITCRTWPDIWLNEGFATYCEALYFERKYGTDVYWSYINSDMSGAKGAAGTIYVQDTTNVDNVFDGARTYDKGGVVLHMLRHVLGDSVFFHSMYNYANTPALRYATASTADFRAVCEATSGKDLGYFFNEWIYGERYPQYIYGWSAEPSLDGYSVQVSISQVTGTTNPPFFTMPVDLEVSSAGWDTTVTVLNDSAIQTFTFNVSHNPANVQLDPNGWILKSITTPLAISPPRIDFGIVNVGSSKIDSVTVTNQYIDTVTVTGTTSDLADISVSPASAVISPLSSRKFYVTFAPTSYGVKSGHAIIAPGLSSVVVGVGWLPQNSYNVSKLWNLVSVPLRWNDPRKNIIFPTASSAAYQFSSESGYTIRDSLVSGVGYWLKFGSDQSVSVAGMRKYVDTVHVKAGWNLVGSVGSKIPAVAVEPEGTSILSVLYGYDRGYLISDTIQPGKGYWLKVSTDGMLILDSAASLSKGRSDLKAAAASAITVADRSGNHQTIYFTDVPDCRINPDRYELPPYSSLGMFDVRWQSNRIMETFDGLHPGEFPIRVSAADYPLSVSWTLNTAVDASILTGRKETRLTSTGAVTVQGPKDRLVLKVIGMAELPQEFSLTQNFPNPFNPSTVIRYALPVRSHVKLQVFDMLGQGVAILVNEEESPGEKSVTFTPSGLPSGVYCYRLEAGTYVAARKLLLLK